MHSNHDRDSLLAGLDDAQREAVTCDQVPLLVVAGAGSGKTRVLTRRIAWRIETGAASARNCLALTFTRKAAGELRSRLAALGCIGVTAGTFHAIALGELRRRALELGRPTPVLVDSKARILAVCAPDRNIRRGRSTLDRREVIAVIATEIEWAKARLVLPEHYATEAAVARREPAVPLEVVANTFAAYEAERKRRKLYDFEDLLATLTHLIRKDHSFASIQRWKFQHVYVDEFQDTNRAQLELLSAWLGGNRDLCCVGDARQAIYTWNGADPSAIEDFTHLFPGAAVRELSTNYRSTEQVVRFAQAALAGPPAPKWETISSGPVPKIMRFDSDEEEAIAIAERLRRLRRTGRHLREMAVLARTNAQLELAARGLEAAGLAFRLTARDRFLDRPTVEEALCVLNDLTTSRRSTATAFRDWIADLSDDLREATEEHKAGDLRALLEVAVEFEELDPAPSAESFRVYLDQTLRRDVLPGTSDAVELLSFHRAKGLEWPVVFVIGLEDGFVPISQARTREALAEERRLLYVALSRASHELYCSWSARRTFGARQVTREPSPYLVGIEAARDQLERESRVDPTSAKRAIEQSRALLQAQRDLIPPPSEGSRSELR